MHPSIIGDGRRCLIVMLSLLLLISFAGAGELPRVAKIAGKAQIMEKGVWNEAKIGQRIAPGQKIRVEGRGEVGIEASSGRVTISVKDDAAVQYDGNVDPAVPAWRSSRLAGAQPPHSAADELRQFSVDQGEVEVEVMDGEPLRIVTPLLTAGVRGTRFAMRVDKDGSSYLTVSQGLIDSYSRTGQRQDVGAGGMMSLSSAGFVQFLNRNNITVPADGDWRSLDPETLEELDQRVADETVYFNPVLNANVKTARVDNVDQEKVSRAAYVGEATLDDLLSNADVHPLADEWVGGVGSGSLTSEELAYLQDTYARAPGYSGGGEDSGSSWGPGYWRRLMDDSLIEIENVIPGQGTLGMLDGNYQATDQTLLAGFQSVAPVVPDLTAVVSGIWTGGDLTMGSISVGFDINITQDNVSNAWMSGSGRHGLGMEVSFNATGGSGSGGTIGNFAGTFVYDVGVTNINTVIDSAATSLSYGLSGPPGLNPTSAGGSGAVFIINAAGIPPGFTSVGFGYSGGLVY